MSKLLQEISKLLPRSRPDRHESGIAHPIQPARIMRAFFRLNIQADQPRKNKIDRKPLNLKN